MMEKSKVCYENAQFNRETGNYVMEHRNSPKIPMGDLFQKRKVTIPKMSSKEMVMGIQEQVLDLLKRLKLKRNTLIRLHRPIKFRKSLLVNVLKKSKRLFN